jgi:hypothetical protein
MQNFFWQVIGFVGGIVYCSFFEWTLHKYIMHRPFMKFFRYPFEAHAIVHHSTFKADDTYHLKSEEDKKTVPMAWWNAPLMWLLHVGPVLGLQWLIGLPIAWGTFVALISYYGAYEYMHWCMHIPRKRNIERSGIFFRLNGHHLLHHRYMHKNFNVVLPLADSILGTLILRSPVSFAQATGPSIPNVQPLKLAA